MSKDRKNRITVRDIAITGILLAICIVFQIFKNMSVFITGPVVNACLIICALSTGLIPALILSVITPVTSFLITGAPVMTAVPPMMPLIMAGNAILVIMVCIFGNKNYVKISLGMAAGSILKALFMGLTISMGVLPHMLPEPMTKMLPAMKIQFSVTQLITAAIGSVIAYVVWIPLSKSMSVTVH